MRLEHTLVWVVWAALIPTLGARSETVALAPVADTTLFETNPTNNLGSEVTLIAGTTNHGFKDRALLRFDIAAKLPTGAVVTSVVLTLNVLKESDISAKSSVFELRSVLVPWSEGNKRGPTGAAASSGETTWAVRILPDTLWTTPGGAETNDFAAVISSSISITTPAAYNLASTPVLVADVQTWLDHPEQNRGWVLRSQSENVSGTARRLGSREDPARAPALKIVYTPGPAPMHMSIVNRSKDGAVMTWSGGTPPFQLQSKPILDETNWSNLGPTLLTNVFPFSFDASQSYFRVMQAPSN